MLLNRNANPARIVPQLDYSRVAIDDSARADAQPFHAVFAETLPVRNELLRDQIHRALGTRRSLKTLAFHDASLHGADRKADLPVLYVNANRHATLFELEPGCRPAASGILGAIFGHKVPPHQLSYDPRNCALGETAPAREVHAGKTLVLSE